MNKFKGALLLATVTMSMLTFAACGNDLEDDDVHVTMTPEQTTVSPAASATPDDDSILPSIDIDLTTPSQDVR